MRLANRAPRRATPSPPTAQPGGSCRIAVASGPAFSFSYTDNLELLEEAGAELISFDPLRDPALPEGVNALIAGGGFPEVFGAALADNRALLADTRSRVNRGLVTWAECGGLLWLGRRLDNHPMCGVIEATGHMTDRVTVGYRTATFRRPSPLGPEGTVVRGHEFRYSTIEPSGDALSLVGRTGTKQGGWASATLFASYLHIHLAGAPRLATELVKTACRSGSR
jgi:cobyrinic acid a,c-diamide synthase